MFADLTPLVNNILYAISGLCFGSFASRCSVFAAKRIVSLYRHEGIGAFLGFLPQISVLAVAFLIFPLWFITKTQLGGFVYYAVLAYFFSKGYRKYVKGKEEE